jgi:hypothetical protein
VHEVRVPESVRDPSAEPLSQVPEKAEAMTEETEDSKDVEDAFLRREQMEKQVQAIVETRSGQFSTFDPVADRMFESLCTNFQHELLQRANRIANHREANLASDRHILEAYHDLCTPTRAKATQILLSVGGLLLGAGLSVAIPEVWARHPNISATGLLVVLCMVIVGAICLGVAWGRLSK